MSNRTLAYAQVDVFAEQVLEGNMLAIFTDGRGLSSAEMQALARETNLSETTFILPAEDPAGEREAGVRVRIFTTAEELPFAGHPTLGTASWLHWHHPTLRGAAEVRLRLEVGTVPVRFTPDGGPGVFGTMAQPEPMMGPLHAPETVAPLLGLRVDDLDSRLPIQTVSTGNPFVIVPVRTAQAMGRLAILQAAAQPWLHSVGARFFFCITQDGVTGADVHARMQFSGGEDPATGSAAGCAAAYLVAYGRLAPEREAVIAQGAEMGRPSRLHIRAGLKDGRPTGVFVGGRTIPVATGQVVLPPRTRFSQP